MVKNNLDSFGNSLFDREKIGYELKKTTLNGNLKIAIIGDGNVDSIENYLYYYFKDYNISTFIGDPGNYLNELLNKDSNLYKFNPDYLFIIVTGDFLVDYYLNADQLDQYEILKASIQNLLVETNMKILISELIISPFKIAQCIDLKLRQKVLLKQKEINLFFQDLDIENDNFNLINTNELLYQFDNMIPEFELLYAKRKFKQEIMDQFALSLFKVVSINMRSSYKCLVLDLDNTLWGGVLSENDEIDYGNDYPGNDFEEFHYYIKQLKNQGILLAINSKNTFDKEFERRFKNLNTLLQLDDFVCTKINWIEKDKNISSIAKELNILEDSMVFVDDSDFEREIVEKNTDSKVIKTTPKPLNYILQLYREGIFDQKILTSDDKQRTNRYLENRKRESEKSTLSYPDFLQSLDLKVKLKTHDIDIVRLSQLILRTNQFNLTNNKRILPEFKDMCKDENYDIYEVQACDKFGNYGICGVVVVDRSTEVPTLIAFAISCRVFDRGIEYAVLKAILDINHKKGNSMMNATFMPTSKNTRFCSFYQDCGFYKIDTDEDNIQYYTVDLKSFDRKKLFKSWITIEED